jgi:hypothetical protein
VIWIRENQFWLCLDRKNQVICKLKPPHTLAGLYQIYDLNNVFVKDELSLEDAIKFCKSHFNITQKVQT